MSDDSEQLTKKDHVLPYLNDGGRIFRPGIYLVATPIGNLRDISLRALDALNAADLIACEDTRVSGKLLKAYDISGKTLVVYNDHSDTGQRTRLIESAREKVVVLLSDAGMPLISDPGYKLVRDARVAGVYLSSIPGANAPLTALQLSGMPSDAFSFIGFLPSKEVARRRVLNEWKDTHGALVAFEAAPRLLKTLVDIDVVLGGERIVAVVRELTKMYEEVRRGSVAELVTYYEESGSPKGEIVLVIAPPVEKVFGAVEVDAMLIEAMVEMRTKDAATMVAGRTGLSKKELYERALELGKS